MIFLNIFAISNELGKISAIAILSFIGVLLLVTIALITWSVLVQKKYETESLPTLEDIDPSLRTIELEDEDEKSVVSAFSFDDEDSESLPSGDLAAEALLQDVRATETGTAKKSFNPFSKR
jgi:hypothetical protein